jgi:hypothetical protein
MLYDVIIFLESFRDLLVQVVVDLLRISLLLLTITLLLMLLVAPFVCICWLASDRRSRRHRATVQPSSMIGPIRVAEMPHSYSAAGGDD